MIAEETRSLRRGEGTGAAGEDGFVEFLHVKMAAEFLFHGVSKLF